MFCMLLESLCAFWVVRPVVPDVFVFLYCRWWSTLLRLSSELRVELASSVSVWITWTCSTSGTMCWGFRHYQMCGCVAVGRLLPASLLVRYSCICAHGVHFLYMMIRCRHGSCSVWVVCFAGGFSSVHSIHFPLQLIHLKHGVGFATQPCIAWETYPDFGDRNASCCHCNSPYWELVGSSHLRCCDKPVCFVLILRMGWESGC